MADRWIDSITCPECGGMAANTRNFPSSPIRVFVCTTCVRWWNLEQELERLRYRKRRSVGDFVRIFAEEAAKETVESFLRGVIRESFAKSRRKGKRSE